MVPMKLNTPTMAATDEQFSTRVLVNTGSNLNQTANDEEGGGGLVGVHEARRVRP